MGQVWIFSGNTQCRYVTRRILTWPLNCWFPIAATTVGGDVHVWVLCSLSSLGISSWHGLVQTLFIPSERKSTTLVPMNLTREAFSFVLLDLCCMANFSLLLRMYFRNSFVESILGRSPSKTQNTVVYTDRVNDASLHSYCTHNSSPTWNYLMNGQCKLKGKTHLTN